MIHAPTLGEVMHYAHRGRGGGRRNHRSPIVPGGAGVVYLLDYSDGTFTRASEASQYGNFSFADGADDLSVSDMTWAGVDVLRKYADGSVLIEGSRTNDCQESENLSVWTVGGGTVAGGTNTAPDGSADGYSLSVPSSNYGLYLTQGSDASSHAFSLFLKRKGGNTVLSRHFGSNSSLALGAMVEPAAPVAWTRFSAVGVMPAGSRRIHLCEGRNAVPTGSSALGAQDQEIWGVQMEGLGALFPTSHIRTAGSAATRARDSMVMPNGTWDTRIATGKFAIPVKPLFASTQAPTSAYLIQCGTGGTAGYLRWSSAAGGQFILQQAGNTVAVTGVTFSAYQDLLLTCDPTNGTLGVSGATTGDGEASGTVGTWPTGVSMYFGSLSAGTQHCDARYGRPYLA